MKSTPEALPNFPVHTVRAAIAAMFVFLCAATYLTAKIGDELRDGMRSQIEVLTATERLEHYGNVLELSIRTVATYGDQQAAARYRAVQPQLRSTLAELREDIRLKENQRSAAGVTAADTALTLMEQEALEHASAGKLREAQQIINSPRYNELLNIYYDGIRSIENRAEAFVASTEAKLDWYLHADVALTLAGIGLIILGWVAILRPARLWGKLLKAHTSVPKPLLRS